jgi:Na+-transporting NADH:ubiquinone oxidoreductase subunit NqrD
MTASVARNVKLNAVASLPCTSYLPFNCIILHTNYSTKMALPWLRRLVAGLSPSKLGFSTRLVRVGFVVDRVALGKVSPITVFPPLLHGYNFM